MTSDASRDAWDPEQYRRFRDERSQPFFDLLALVQPSEAPRVLDLGCGTGELTLVAHRRLGARETLGIDHSPAMLGEADKLEADDALSFRLDDIGRLELAGHFDVVLSNAALQWLPDHAATLRRWAELLAPDGQIAVQLPANWDHPSHQIASELAREAPFAELIAAEEVVDPAASALAPEAYAQLLHSWGFADQHVRLQVYGHRLESTAEVVEWVRGTNLTRFRAALPTELFEAFVDRYRERLLDALGDRRPFFYTFKRILLWGRR